MGTNASSCKAWSITLVSAILVVVADKNKPNYALIAMIPIGLFLLLDAYYLALEKGFRNAYNAFIDKLHEDEVLSSDVYAVAPKGRMICLVCMSLRSFSIWPFYITLLLMVLLARKFIL